jgi:hypothetical protein
VPVDNEVQTNAKRQVEGPDCIFDHVVSLFVRQSIRGPQRSDVSGSESGSFGQLVEPLVQGHVVESRNTGSGHIIKPIDQTSQVVFYRTTLAKAIKLAG